MMRVDKYAKLISNTAVPSKIVLPVLMATLDEKREGPTASADYQNQIEQVARLI
jgi:hypothetical protein